MTKTPYKQTILASSGGSGPLNLRYAARTFGAVKPFSKPFEANALIAVINEELATLR